MTTLNKKKLLDELRDKESREIFAAEHVTTGIPFQLHALREKLGVTQAELARRAKMAQERISVLEDPNYEFIPKINTLLKLANVFDVPLIVKFGTWEELFNWETGLSPDLLAPQTFDESLENLKAIANGWTVTVPQTVVGTTAMSGNIETLKTLPVVYRVVAPEQESNLTLSGGREWQASFTESEPTSLQGMLWEDNLIALLATAEQPYVSAYRRVSVDVENVELVM